MLLLTYEYTTLYIQIYMLLYTYIQCTADLKLENVLFTHNTLKKVEVQQSGNTYTVEVPVNTSIKRKYFYTHITTANINSLSILGNKVFHSYITRF